MSNPSKYNFPNAQKVQIFERVDTYIENNNPSISESKTSSAANPEKSSTSSDTPLTLFYSYTHADEASRDPDCRLERGDMRSHVGSTSE